MQAQPNPAQPIRLHIATVPQADVIQLCDPAEIDLEIESRSEVRILGVCDGGGKSIGESLGFHDLLGSTEERMTGGHRPVQRDIGGRPDVPGNAELREGKIPRFIPCQIGGLGRISADRKGLQPESGGPPAGEKNLDPIDIVPDDPRPGVWDRIGAKTAVARPEQGGDLGAESLDIQRRPVSVQRGNLVGGEGQ